MKHSLSMKNVAMLSVCMSLSGAACAQSVSERTGINSTFGVAPDSADFISEAVQSDMFQIQASNLAAQRTTGDVQTLAKQMVSDHTKTTTALTGFANDEKLALPITMSSVQQNMLTNLLSLEGQDFAKKYLADQVTADKDAVSLYERYRKSGDNDHLKSWASETLPTLQQHLDIAQATYGKM